MKQLKTKYANIYSYLIEYDQEDNIFIARCAELPSVKAHGSSQEKALHEIKVAVLATLKWMKEDGEDLPEPLSLHKYSGQFKLRIPPAKHKQIAIEAKLQNVSMNQFIASKL